MIYTLSLSRHFMLLRRAFLSFAQKALCFHQRIRIEFHSLAVTSFQRQQEFTLSFVLLPPRRPETLAGDNAPLFWERFSFKREVVSHYIVYETGCKGLRRH